MNRFEKIIYDRIKNNTKIKNLVRDIYQKILSKIPKKPVKTNYNIIEREGYFFGFHDKVPWSFNNDKLLAHKFEISNRAIKPDDEVEIGYFFGNEFKKFKKIDTTLSWNWQQGSMLQWLNENDDIIFNYWNGHNNVAKIIDVDGNKRKEFDIPIGAVSRTGEWALSYSFERLNIGMAGYGYMNENDPEKNNPISDKSGLILINIKTGEKVKLFSIKEIANFKPQKSMNNAYHFFTHCLFSPNSQRLLFLHRWYKKGERLNSRMISCDLDGDHKYIFPTNNFVSHITWVNSDKVLAYCNTKENGDGYFLFEDMKEGYKQIGKNKYNSDGHPQYCSNNNKIVTDTYPNRFRIQELSTYNLEKNQKSIIANLHSPLKFKDILRCDLHPRWDRNGEMICFDSAHTGTRSLCTIDLSDANFN